MSSSKAAPSIDELIELPNLDDPQIAPDGTRVAFVVVKPDWKQNAFVRQLWLVSTGGGQPRQLTFTKGGSEQPRWSPDGRWLAFVSKREGDEHKQIYLMAADGGEAERLTEMETDCSKPAWAPDGESIAFLAPEPESATRKERKERYGEYQVEDQDYTRSHLWLVKPSDKKVRRLTGGEGYHVTECVWSPDRASLAFAAQPTPDERDVDRGRIYVLDTANLETRALTEEGCLWPRWSPDGKRVAFVRFGTPSYYANSTICVVAASGGEARPVSGDFDEDPWLQGWGPDGLYYAAIAGTSIHLYRMDPESGTYERLTPEEPAGWFSMGATFSQDFAWAAAVAGDAERAAEVAAMELRAQDAERPTVTWLTAFTRDVASWPGSRREVCRWNSRDGTPVEGVVTKPPDFDPGQKYPLLVVIHGGPTWVSLLLRLAGYDRRIYPTEIWAGKGALILEPNYRGSSGYGEAFRRLNVRNLGLGDYDDVVSGVDALIEWGWVDPERVAALGWSQGGYISAFITTYSDRFRAVSVGAGISNWTTYYANTDIHPFTRQYLGATPWEEPEVYEKTSPMTYIKQARTPTLIQHGQNDQRVPVPNAYELYQGLSDMGVETRLVVYPGMGHGPDKPRQCRQIMEENLAWFNRWLWNEGSAEAETAPCYVTLCSAAKREETGDLPAIQRYTSERIQDVWQQARRDGAEFRIFSGRYGLLRDQDPIPWYDHLLELGEVSEMARRLVAQLQEQQLKRIVLFLADTKEDPKQLVYAGCLQAAVGAAGIEMETRPAG